MRYRHGGVATPTWGVEGAVEKSSGGSIGASFFARAAPGFGSLGIVEAYLHVAEGAAVFVGELEAAVTGGGLIIL